MFWPWYFDKELIYIGDGYDRCIVKPIKDKNGNKHIGTLQCFVWPDGKEHAVPVHTVFVNTEAVRREKGLLE